VRRSLIVFLAVLALLFAGCARRPRRIVIGIALTLGHHPGAELAVKQINESGGVDGVPVELMGLDWQVTTQFESKEILAWARRFADTDDLIAVIGHSDSSSTLSAAAFYNQHHIPQIVTIATNPAITNIGSWTYRLCLSDATQGPALADYAIRDWGKKRIAVFYVNDAYGRGLAELFERRVRELGGEIVSTIMHRNALRPDDKELILSELQQLKASRQPELFVLFQRSGAADWTIRAIRDAGIQADILGADNLSLVDFSRLNPQIKEGIRVSQFFEPLPENARAIEFREAYQDFAGRPPEYGQASAYDAVNLVCQAARTGGFSRDGVKGALDRCIAAKTRVEGAGGPYVLGEDHDARRSLYIVEAHGGSYHLLKTVFSF